MNLIERKDFLNAGQNNSFPVEGLSSVLMNTLKLNKVNKLYSKNYEKKNQEFLEAVLQELEVKYDFDPYELSSIPQKGPFITVSNHPLGGIDGLLLMKLVATVRQDFKVMGNFLLQKIEPIEDFLIPVNPFDGKSNLNTSIGGIKKAIKHLSQGHPLGIFPAGEVSSFNERVIQDKAWSKSALKFIKNQKVPIVPVYFHGYNSNFFYMLGLINPMFRTVKLPSELFNKKNKKLTVRIGKPIMLEEQELFYDVSQFGRYLRSKTYALGNAIEVKKFYQFSLTKQKTKEQIARPFNIEMIAREIDSLSSDCLLISSGPYRVFFTSPDQIPLTMNEIGRLRERTFREIGEGTNRSLDLDEYDLYYQHLFIWDVDRQKVVGSYRVGKGKEIMKYFGKKGFYIHSLFSMKKRMEPILEKSLELGRSFIVEEYQKNAICLLLLWKGILSVLLKNSEYRYLVGPVSISNHYSDLSKNLIIEFIKTNYYHHPFANLVKAKKPFKFNPKKVDTNIMLEQTQGDLSKLDKIIEEIEPSHFKMPVLFKKYLRQNAKIMGFNVDPRFNSALDGLMILDLFEVPLNTLKSLSKEMKNDDVLQRFYEKHAMEEYAKTPQF